MIKLRESKLKEGEIIPLTYDKLFIDIFNNPDNIGILEEFLAVYLNVSLEKIEGKVKLLPRELKTGNKSLRDKQVDLLLKLDKEIINIEISNRSSQGITDRNIIFACSSHAKQLGYKDNDYSKIEKTLQICLNNFKCNKHNLVEKYYLKNEYGEILSEKIEIDMVDMVKGEKICYNEPNNKLAMWCKALKTKLKVEFEKLIEGVIVKEEMKHKIVDEVEKYSDDLEYVEDYINIKTALSKEEMERNTYMVEAIEKGLNEGMERGLKEGRQKGLEEGRKQGLEEGRKLGIEKAKKEVYDSGITEGIIQIARNLKANGISIDMIIKSTNLTKDEIERL